MREIKPKADFLIEVSYEIVTGVGGIHRVIESKASSMKDYYGNNYLLIGIYDPMKAKVQFKEESPDDVGLTKVFKELKREGIDCHYGSWLVAGNPKAILIDIIKYWGELININKEIKKDYGFSVKYDFKYYDSFAVWGYAAGKLIEKMLEIKQYKNKKGVVHIHEWVSGVTLLYLKKHGCNVKTIFTTHATSLGRGTALNKEDLNKEIKKRTSLQDARAKRYKDRFGYNIYDRHLLEKELAKLTDIFTSVSETTAKEAEYTLKRKADVVTPNGLKISSFPSMEERAILHDISRKKINKFLNSYFLPYYLVEVKDSLLFFTSGRYEFTTKGYDIFFEALGNLNKQLKEENYENNIFVFLFIMVDNKKSNEEVLENMALYSAIEHEIEKEFPHLKYNITNSLIHGEDIAHKNLFDESFLINTKKLILKFTQRKDKLPPICAFKGLKNNDPLLKCINKSGLLNKEDDKVRIIFYPAPVSVADGLLSMEYNHVTAGMHLGAFPSIYEPWGYTPLETAASGVMSLTTDVAGFGKFILQNTDLKKKKGIFVLHVEGRKHEEIVDDLAKTLHSVCMISRKERIVRKLEAQNTTKLADWKEMAKYYIKAHNLAVDLYRTSQKTRKNKR